MQVFACGDNQSGQLGLGFYAEMGYVPDPVPLVTRLLEVTPVAVAQALGDANS